MSWPVDALLHLYCGHPEQLLIRLDFVRVNDDVVAEPFQVHSDLLWEQIPKCHVEIASRLDNLQYVHLLVESLSSLVQAFLVP